MRKKTWGWIKFFVLMLSVGVVISPVTFDLPTPLVLAIVSCALLAMSGVMVRHACAVRRLITAPAGQDYCTPVSASAWPFSMPTDPGTAGSVRARAPAANSIARG